MIGTNVEFTKFSSCICSTKVVIVIVANILTSSSQ